NIDTKVKPVKAPIVGVVYLQAKPGQPAFINVGDHVKKGDTICVIEAMKMMTEVKSTLTGTVSEIKVENEDLVEVGQPLITVKED
ncbi:MAG: acetyl-CoA carboxylase, biotin carboxyl carrier protein, partial [Lactobacillus crispatus]|nr:acetyl-CoA carboxylase, biotin carboxyl carrier protein [Lactobacillus crispatus]MCT7708020.1 acetyl-CoA carboxylase, biotin carboxyl carrier protein [Lactobacillus crispatus]